jgi:tetratricopeptide (TPR) repeat protein
MTQSGSDKASRYMQALDSARCTGHWHEVPELARKVEKHAPKRKTLALVARSEAVVSTTEISRLNTSLAPLIKPLQLAIEQDKDHPEDVFQASVCVAWIFWLLQDHQQAADVLTTDPGEILSASSSQWLLVCTSKRTYIKGFSLEKIGETLAAGETYQSAIPFLLSLPASSFASTSREFRLWTERLLCRYVARTVKTGPVVTAAEFDRILLVFHLWGLLFNYHPTDQRSRSHITLRTSTPDFELGLEVEFTRWDMWMAYYETLTQILQLDFVYCPTYTDLKPHILVSGQGVGDQEFIAARLKQRTELKSVELKIEAKLLEETSFPKAGVRNDRVERWVDAVMDNWRTLCGTNWVDEELGEGGKNAIARGVLDILYRAATKTFHSTQILRHLFTVHAYLAELDLAMKALDSYLELVTRARARCAESGEPDYSLDNNNNVLSIMAEAITMLCQFGQRQDAEKAREIAGKLKLWIDESEIHPEIAESSMTVNGHAASAIDRTASPSVVARAYHALGVSEAHWSRLTYDASSRTQHQNKAQESFRQALHRKYGNSKNLSYLYSLAILLAEMRDIAGALKITKLALAEASPQAESDESYVVERKLIRFWHLLTLLLSSRTDFLNAAKASTAAFEQFQDIGILFGQQEYRSEHLNETEKLSSHSPALIDTMGTLEKAGILQVKMTQVALLEALEGPAQAVDASLDLLALYVRLFGHPPGKSSIKTTTVTQKMPKSRLGSIRASIFKRATSRRGNNRVTMDVSKLVSRPQTAGTTTTAPTIHVTDLSSTTESRGRTQNESMSSSKVGSIRKGVDVENSVRRSRSRSQVRKRNSLMNSLDSLRQASPTGTARNGKAETVATEDSSVGEKASRTSMTSTVRPSTAGSLGSSAFSVIRNSRHKKRDSRISMQTIESDGGTENAIGLVSPVQSIPDLVDKRYRNSMLIELWLFVSGMYCRSEIYEEAKDAIDEAEQLVAALEMETARTSSSAKSFSSTAWGGGKSIDELKGDIMTKVSIQSH